MPIIYAACSQSFSKFEPKSLQIAGKVLSILSLFTSVGEDNAGRSGKIKRSVQPTLTELVVLDIKIITSDYIKISNTRCVLQQPLCLGVFFHTTSTM